MIGSATEQTGARRNGWLSRIADGGPTLPLVVFFGLNAVDELDRSAAAILTPEIREHFDLSRARYLGFVALVVLGGLLLQPVVAIFADRYPRIRLALIGAILWALFSFMTGLALGLVLFLVARAGSGVGKAVNDPTHRSLLADWYRPQTRPKVYSLHAAANAVGATVGPLTAGLLAYYFGWRTPFLFFAIPTLIFVAVGMRLREPVRGAQERALAGGSSEAIATEELPPSAAEAWRMCWKIQALRRIWLATPFLSASLIGFATLASELYADAYGLDERARGVVAAASEPGQLVGLIIGARIATKLLERDPGLILRFLALVSVITSALSGVFAIVPNLAVAIAANVTIALCLAIVGPGIVASLSLAIPPRARAMGFSIGSLFIVPGLLILPMIGWIADSWGIRTGMSVMVPVFLIGGLVISTGGNVISSDIDQVRRTTLARAEVLAARRRGEVKLLYCSGVSAGYDGVRVLHDIDFEVDKGEIVALLGTNGAGKSTFLNAVSGVVQADRGAIIFDGRDVTHAPPNEIAGFGIVQIPGGAGVFPGLTVGENLEAAGWLTRRDRSEQRAAHDRVLEAFHELTERLDDRAADLSGGQQQMLALGMTFLLKPKLLMVDELSLGLAPIVVERLLRMVREIAAEGVTVILVEQSVNVALELAETAYFMERGRIRFNGPTQELLRRRDLLRSVFLGDVGPPQAQDQAELDVEVEPDLEVQAQQGSELLKVTGLARRFGGVHAVSDVSFTVGAAEIVGLIGPNGAGKTTLFDLIAGSTPADAGTVILSGRNISRQSASARARQGLGRSFQDARLFPSLTVAEVIAVSLERWISWGDPVTAALYLPMAFDSEASIAERVDELIELMGLEPYRHKRVRELSTGTRRIVDLACVLAHRATVVLLDEPSSGIAQSEVEALAPLLSRMRSEMGASLLVIEHDMNLVTAICDRVLALDQGAVVATGTPSEVLNDPKVLAAYLGNPVK
ncbi:MAG: MFS transporter [Acidimicrobiaceae bacterium]|nr:MFS transporter [Acidimicrobiaceae bacterium]MYC43853.1 MFS transporter [Acidimicrobiaceae bacterium]